MRASLYRLLAPRTPDEIDAMVTWQVGALLKHDQIETDETSARQANAILEARKQAVLERQRRRG